MHRRSYPIIGVTLTLVLWMAVDCQTQATPLDLVSTLTSPTPAPEDLTPDQQALLEFLQNDGMAALICYGGYVIIPPPNGVNEPPKDTSGDPKDPVDPPVDPPDEPPPEEPPTEHSPEPGSIVLGLVGLGVTSLAYVRRRRRR